MKRLQHPHFGMDTFFVCQNASSKFDIRVFSTILSNIHRSLDHSSIYRPSPFMVYSAAALLRFLTPAEAKSTFTSRGVVFVGKLPFAETHSQNYMTT